MDTGGKVATGILVPLVIGAAVVGGWFLFRPLTKLEKEFKEIEKEWHDALKTAGIPIPKGGGKRRRTHRRRR